jgi:hypothetical protein
LIADKLLSRVYGMKMGWCFTPKDFLDLGSQSAILVRAIRTLGKDGIDERALKNWENTFPLLPGPRLSRNAGM